MTEFRKLPGICPKKHAEWKGSGNSFDPLSVATDEIASAWLEVACPVGCPGPMIEQSNPMDSVLLSSFFGKVACPME